MALVQKNYFHANQALCFSTVVQQAVLIRSKLKNKFFKNRFKKPAHKNNLK